MKKILRGVFSKDLRQEFQAKHGKRYSSWALDRLRSAIRDFFVPKVGTEMFFKHEAVYIRLIMSTWSARELEVKYQMTVDSQFDATIKSVLGNFPNQYAISCFFKHEAIQGLWIKPQARTWVYHEVRSLSIEDRQKLYKYFEKIPVGEFQVLP